MIHWEKSSASSRLRSISTLLFTIQPKPNDLFTIQPKPNESHVSVCTLYNGWIIHLTFSNLIEQLIHNSIDWKFLQRVQQSDQSLLTFFQYTTIQIFDTGWFLQLIPPCSVPKWWKANEFTDAFDHLKFYRECNNHINLCLPSFNICNE